MVVRIDLYRLYLLWSQTSALETHGLRVEEGGGDGGERVTGRIAHGGALTAVAFHPAQKDLPRIFLGCRRRLCCQMRHTLGWYCPR
jgi:hypothetical protein